MGYMYVFSGVESGWEEDCGQCLVSFRAEGLMFCSRRFGKCPRREKIKSSFLLVASKRVCLGCPISCSFMVLFRATVKGAFIEKNRSAPLSSSLRIWSQVDGSRDMTARVWEVNSDYNCVTSLPLLE